MSHLAYIALGSNLGDRNAHIAAAIDQLGDHDNIAVLKTSSIYETQPVGGPPQQPDYLNAVVAVQTTLGALDLFECLRQIEENLHRQRSLRWGPRTIDLDLLLYDQDIIDKPDLAVPHPRMHQRRFVMEPLTQIAPHVLHPILKRTAGRILQELMQNAHAHNNDG